MRLEKKLEVIAMRFNNILVVIDPMLESQPSLLRALHLAKQLKKADTPAKLTLFLSLYDFHSK